MLYEFIAIRPVSKMKFVVLFNLLFVLGVSQAQFGIGEESDLALVTELQSARSLQTDQGKIRIFRRSTRNIFSALKDTYTAALEKIIIDNCKANNQYEAAEKLQPIFDEMKACLGKKKILITPKEEYLAFIEECRKESVNKSKSCLAESQRYFPEVILELSKATANFMYDHIDIVRSDLVNCLPKIANSKVLTKHKQCLHDVSVRTNDTRVIKDSKEGFCQSIIPAAYCFTDMLKENCDATLGIEKIGKDYIAVRKQICNVDNDTL